ncbi:MAG: hypothetical protein WBN20_09735, partial [Eudoraea sp.]|uniref:hypothetical protein n=2 Tax=Eudoraea sp. TaxID=1979955 RepID=UPI003C73E644
MLKKIAKFIAGLILILGIVFGAIFFYVKGHKEEVVNFVVNTISEKHNGTVSFDDVTLRSWGNFTNPAFYVKNMVLLDSSDSKITRFEARKVYLNLTVRSLLKEKIQVKSVRIENANYSSVITKEDLTALTANKDSLPKENRVSEIFKPYKMSFDIENFTFDIQNIPRHKRIKFTINEISSNLLVGPDKITSSMDLDAHITQLGFNLEKGSYLKDSKIEGTMYPEIDLANNKIHIPSFDLSIKDQIFKLTADFDTSRQSSFLFELVNEETEYEPTVSLLSDHIQLKLNKYKIDRAFPTHTTLQGSFAPFSNPLVHVEFNSVENSALIIDRFDLDNLSFTGSFTNRIYDDERAKTEDKKDLKLIFNTLTGKYRETHFLLNNASLKSTPEAKASIEGLLKVNGNPNDLISLLEEPIFTLKKGSFTLDADLNGDGTSVAALLSSAGIVLHVNNTSVYEEENDISIPVKELRLHLNGDTAVLDVLELPMNNGDKLLFDGQINHFSSILSKESKNKALTKLNIKSPKLNWDDFINLFKSTPKSNKENVKPPQYVLQEILNKINRVYSPSVDIAIKEFAYKSLILENLTTNLSFRNENNLSLYNMAFDIPSGAVKLNADLNYQNEEEIIVNATLEANGTPEILNDLFNSDTFLFKSGSFALKADINGDVMSLDNLLLKSNTTLNLTEGTLIYKPINLTIPVNLMDVTIKDNRAILNDLQISIGPEDKLNFTGELDDITAFITADPDTQVNSSILLQSDNLQWDDFIKMFDNGNNEKKDEADYSSEVRLKETLRGIYSKFNPRIGISIDNFGFKDILVLKSFKTGLNYKDTNSIVLEESGFNFHTGGQATFSAQVDISKPKETFVNLDLDVQSDPAELNEILNYDTFLLEGGILNLTAKIAGCIENLDELISSSTSTFKIENSSLVHNSSKVKIPFSILEIDILNDDAILKSLNIELPSGDKIILEGQLNNITSILPEISGNNERMSSKLNIYSKKLRFSDFLDLFNTVDSVKKVKKPNRNLALKNVVKDFYNKYQPELSVKLDEFIFNKLIINNFNTGFYFENENLLYLENTDFDFYKGKVNLDAYLDITDPFETQFSLGFSTDNIDLEKL